MALVYDDIVSLISYIRAQKGATGLLFALEDYSCSPPFTKNKYHIGKTTLETYFPGIFSILKVPLEDLPLYVSREGLIGYIVAWRLKIER